MTNAEAHFSRFVTFLCQLHIPDESENNRAMALFSPKATDAPLPNAKRLLAHRAGTTLAGIGLLNLGLSDALGEDLGILVRLILDLLGLAALKGDAVTLVLEALGSNQALNMRSLGVGLLALALGLDLATDDVLADIVFLAEAEEAADLGRTLGTEALGLDGVGKSRDVLLALLDDRESEDGEIGTNDASADRLALALAGAAGAVAGVAVGEEKADTGRGDNTLLHGKTLLVVAAGDADNVALPLIANGFGRDLSAHALLVEVAELALVLDVDQLLGAIGRVGDVQLHLGGGC